MATRKRSSIIAIMLIIILVFMSACQAKDNTAEPTPAPVNTPAPADTAATEPAEVVDPMAKYDPPIKLTGAMFDNGSEFPQGEDWTNNRWLDHYRDTLGVDLEFSFITTGVEYPPKLTSSIATGDIPDIITLDSISFQTLYENDELADLTEAFDEYASDLLKKILTETETGKEAMGLLTRDGKLYGLPQTNASLAANGLMMMIRSDWMEELNLPDPQSLQDVIKIAEAFALQDPDNNGQDDTYGISVARSFQFAEFGDLSVFFNGYHAYPRMWLDDGNGGLKYGSIQPEMKTALQSLQNLFNKKVLSPDLNVNTVESEWDAARNGKVGIVFGNRNSPRRVAQTITEETPNIDWKVFPAMSIDSTPAKVNGRNVSNTYYGIRSGYANPEVIIKMANAFVEQHYEYPSTKDNLNPLLNHKLSEEKTITTHNYALIKIFNPNAVIDEADDIMSALKDPSKINDFNRDIVASIQAYPDDLTGWLPMRTYGDNSSFSVVSQYDKNDSVMKERFTGPPTPTMISNNQILDDLSYEYFTKIIMGESHIDEFDQFVEQWKKLGGDQITAEVNAWYKAK